MVRSRPASPSWAPCLPASTPPPHRKAPSRAEHRYRGCQSFLRSSSLPPQEIHPAALAASLNSTVLFYPLCLSPKNCLQGSSEDAVPQSPRPAPERPPRLPNPTQDPVLPLHPLYPGAPPTVPAGLEEGDHLSVHIGEPLDKDEVARVLEDAQPGARDGPGEGRRVGDGHVAVLGAVNHERGRGYAPNIPGEVKAGPGPGLLVVGGIGGRVSETPAYELLKLLFVLCTIRLGGRRLQSAPDHALGTERTPPEHVPQGLHGHRFRPPSTVAGTDQDQAVDKVGPEQRQLLSHKTAERSSEDVGLLYAKVVK